jgi:hypothetical protein
VSQGIVDVLEAIKVKHQNSHGLRFCQCFFDIPVEVGAVGKSGQDVRGGETEQLRFLLLAGGDVLQMRVEHQLAAVLPAEEREAKLELRPILAQAVDGRWHRQLVECSRGYRLRDQFAKSGTLSLGDERINQLTAPFLKIVAMQSGAAVGRLARVEPTAAVGGGARTPRKGAVPARWTFRAQLRRSIAILANSRSRAVLGNPRAGMITHSAPSACPSGDSSGMPA